MTNTLIFSDGASRGNPGSGGWGAIVALENEVFELGGKEANTTNNRMEMTGALEALCALQNKKLEEANIILYTDSKYLVKGITEWIYIWQKNGFKTKDKKEVLNKDLWESLAEVSKNFDIDWRLLPGHSGVSPNERCDEIATSFADGKNPKLFNGPKGDYKVSLSLKVDENLLKEKSNEKSRKGAKAYSYLSKINGEIKIHQTWADCEARVRGEKNAQFRKVLSEKEERELLEKWKNNP